MESTLSIEKFRLGILVYLSFKESRFSEKISVQGDKIILFIYILSEVSAIFGQMVRTFILFYSSAIIILLNRC